jgi:hypothetical protein
MNHEAFLQAMQAFDWSGAGAREQALAAEGEECCPAGFGAERLDGGALHIYSSDGQTFGGSLTVVQKKKILGFIPSTSRTHADLADLSGEAVRSLLQVFFEADLTALEAHRRGLG